MLKARECVVAMRAYESLVTNPECRLRLDLNESAIGCSPRVAAKFSRMDAKSIALYPAREPGEKLAADFLGLDAEQVLLTNGADEGIDLLCRAFLEPDDEMVIVTPAFSMYEIFAQATVAKLVRVPAAEDFAFPVDRMLQAIGPRTRMLMITNPNNPTGTLAQRDDIMKLLRAAPEAAVLVDEAYFDFCGETVMDQIGKINNLFIVRTFSKAYGLAGLRLGVLAGAAEHISVVRRLCSPFNVNAFAMDCLAEALADGDFVAAYTGQVRMSREWLRAQMESLGFQCWPSHANFLLVRFGEQREAILAELRARGISLRNRPDCAGCVRITIGTQDEMEYLISEMKQVLNKTSARMGQ